MKRLVIFILLSSIIFSACKKAFEQPTEWGSFAVIQASPVFVDSSLSVTNPVFSDTLQVFVDTMRYNGSNIFYNTNTGYLPVRPGTKNIDIRRGVNSTYAKYVNTFSYSFESLKAYSFFVYDTTTSRTAQARVVRLKDDLTLPAAGNSHIRFLHLAPNGPAIDVTLIRTSVAPTGTPALTTVDSTTISNRTYVGTSPNEEALSAFSVIPRGTLYTVKVKAAGTQTVLLQTTLNLTQANSAGSDVNEGRIVTLYATGTAKRRPLAVGVFRHY